MAKIVCELKNIKQTISVKIEQAKRNKVIHKSGAVYISSSIKNFHTKNLGRQKP